MKIVIVGCGRMGQGIAVTFALAGYQIDLIDIKKRNKKEISLVLKNTKKSIENNLKLISHINLIKKIHIKKILKNITILHHSNANDPIRSANIIFECVPEKLNIKKDILKIISNITSKKVIISSTTSSILSSDLAKHTQFPERFLNAHWLNPPYLMPLIEISPCKNTSTNNLEKTKKLFLSIGKVPVICKPSPGYIVPRIQALAMNEAAKILEEKTATSEDINKATTYGFGLRFATLGLLEFIDWGGIDTLNNASNYMTKTMKNKKFSSPNIVKQHIKNKNLGLSTQSGFLDWKNIDIEKYQQEKLKKFVKIIKLLNIQPKINIS